MTDQTLNLDAARARHQAVRDYLDHEATTPGLLTKEVLMATCEVLATSCGDVPALIAEVERLQAALALQAESVEHAAAAARRVRADVAAAILQMTTRMSGMVKREDAARVAVGCDWPRCGCSPFCRALERDGDAPTPATGDVVQLIRESLVASDRCTKSQRVDGPYHSWQFDGDDPYIVCHWCGETRDAIDGRVIKAGEG